MFSGKIGGKMRVQDGGYGWWQWIRWKKLSRQKMKMMEEKKECQGLEKILLMRRVLVKRDEIWTEYLLYSLIWSEPIKFKISIYQI